MVLLCQFASRGVTEDHRGRLLGIHLSGSTAVDGVACCTLVVDSRLRRSFLAMYTCIGL
jgi:hypothetical protein